MGKKFGFSFSWRRALGISSAKTKLSREIGSLSRDLADNVRLAELWAAVSQLRYSWRVCWDFYSCFLMFPALPIRGVLTHSDVITTANAEATIVTEGL